MTFRIPILPYSGPTIRDLLNLAREAEELKLQIRAVTDCSPGDIHGAQEAAQAWVATSRTSITTMDILYTLRTLIIHGEADFADLVDHLKAGQWPPFVDRRSSPWTVTWPKPLNPSDGGQQA